jgi:hypothetical protein
LFKAKRKFDLPTSVTGTLKRPKLNTPAKSCENETARNQANGDQDALVGFHQQGFVSFTELGPSKLL